MCWLRSTQTSPSDLILLFGCFVVSDSFSSSSFSSFLPFFFSSILASFFVFLSSLFSFFLFSLFFFFFLFLFFLFFFFFVLWMAGRGADAGRAGFCGHIS